MKRKRTTPYDVWVENEAKAIESDGCTLVSELFHHCCSEHDLAYRLKKDPRKAYLYWIKRCVNYWDLAKPITRAEADRRFRECMQSHSTFGKFSPVAWVRWAGVRMFGQGAWSK